MRFITFIWLATALGSCAAPARARAEAASCRFPVRPGQGAGPIVLGQAREELDRAIAALRQGLAPRWLYAGGAGANVVLRLAPADAAAIGALEVALNGEGRVYRVSGPSHLFCAPGVAGRVVVTAADERPASAPRGFEHHRRVTPRGWTKDGRFFVFVSHAQMADVEVEADVAIAVEAATGRERWFLLDWWRAADEETAREAYGALGSRAAFARWLAENPLLPIAPGRGIYRMGAHAAYVIRADGVARVVVGR